MKKEHHYWPVGATRAYMSNTRPSGSLPSIAVPQGATGSASILASDVIEVDVEVKIPSAFPACRKKTGQPTVAEQIINQFEVTFGFTIDLHPLEYCRV